MKKIIIAIVAAILFLSSCTPVTEYVDRWDATKSVSYGNNVVEYEMDDFYWLFYEDVLVMHRREGLPNERGISWIMSPWDYSFEGDQLHVWKQNWTVERNGDSMILSLPNGYFTLYLTRHR